MHKSTYLRVLTILAVLAFGSISSATAGTIAAERWAKNDGLWSEHLGSYFTPETQVNPHALGGSKLPSNFVATDRTHNRFTF